MISAGDRPRSLAVLLAAVLVGSLVAPAAFAGSTAAAPAGMASIPDANVAEEVPAGESIPLDAADLQAGRVMASDHADSLEVVLTTPDRAATIMGTDSAAISGNRMAVVLRDDEHSAGRRVALDAGRLQDALGYQPEAIYGTHEDGSEWTATAKYVDGYLVFDVPHFSTNTVTFSGELSISATGADDGTQFEYDVSNETAVTNPELTLTGSANNQWNNRTVDIYGGEGSVTVGGNREPTGPANGAPELVIEAGSTNSKSQKLAQWSSKTDRTTRGGTVDMGGSLGLNNSYDGGTDNVKILVYGWNQNGNPVEGGLYIDGNYKTKLSDNIASYGDGSGKTDEPIVYTTSLSPGSHTFEIDPTKGTYDGQIYSLYVKWENKNGPKDPELDIGNDGSIEWSYDGAFSGSERIRADELSSGVNPIGWTTSNNYDINPSLNIKERTITSDPTITIDSGDGSQSIDYNGVLNAGETTDLSPSVDESVIGGDTTLSVSMPNVGGPNAQVGLNYSHTAQNQVTQSFASSVFEESYNISTTYGDSTTNARVTIPFDSNNVVGIKSAEYRINGSSWDSINPSNRRFENTTMTVYLSDEYGGKLPAGATVDVRTTGRKVSVDNGQVSIVDPTKPGDELDTQLRIDDRSEDFALNVGPTSNGRRVHYAHSNDYPTEDYVVIQANGDQDLHLPDSKIGDTFRVRHLKTKVEPKQGDVRIDVLKAGSNPELDVSPGPGGAGDPVDFEYYRTKSGAEYILKSLTDSIVRDSDVAQSPAIFSDDDSDETLAITLDSVASTASQTGGAVGGAVAGAGQFAADQATGLLGMISLPVDGSPILWLLGIVGLGFVVFRTDLLSGSGDGLDDAGEAAGGLTRTAGRAVSGAGSGILAGLRGLLGYLGEIAAVILSNRRATIVATILLAISLSAAGVIPITEDVAILLVLAGIPIASYIGLRSNGLFSQRVWLASTAIATLVGVELVAPGTLQIAIEQLTSEAVAPLLILLVGGAAYLYYRTRQAEASTPGTVIRTVIGNDDDGNN